MNNFMTLMKVCMMTASLVLVIPAHAKEIDHSRMNHDMDRSSMPGKTALQKLTSMPASGKAREGGYDGRYVMESTDVENALSARCAQASRGLVMMNNAEWSRCGGKPDGAAQTSSLVVGETKNTNEHAGHNM